MLEGTANPDLELVWPAGVCEFEQAVSERRTVANIGSAIVARFIKMCSVRLTNSLTGWSGQFWNAILLLLHYCCRISKRCYIIEGTSGAGEGVGVGEVGSG